MSGFDPLRQAIHSGMRAIEAGDVPAAIAAFQQATLQAPSHAGARMLLGSALLSAGQIAAAIGELERAAQLAKSDAGILGNLGQAYAAAGRHEEAQQVFRKAARIDPRNPQYVQGAAIALAQQGRLAEAQPLLERLTLRFPDNPLPWYNLGNIHRELQQLSAAERCYREVLAIAPGHIDARNNLGSVLHAQLRFADAADAYNDCITAQADHVAAHLNLISVLIDDGRFAQAEAVCRKLLQQAPELPEAHRFLAAALNHQGNTAAALPAFARAATLAPGDPSTRRSYAGALAEAGLVHHALRELHHAAALDPGTDALPQLRSMLLLAEGMFIDGWSAYRRRPAFLRFAEKSGADPLTQQLPENIAGKHILVLREQGLGDELFFLRYAAQLSAQGARVTIRASAKIASLILRSGCAADVITGEDLPSEQPDLQMLCGDLPHALGAQAQAVSTLTPVADSRPRRDFAVRIGARFPALPQPLHISPRPDALAAMRERLKAAGDPPYLGLTWRAGTAAREQSGAHWALSKEIGLAALAQNLRGVRGTLVVLQRLPAPGELETLAAVAGRPAHDGSDLNDDLEHMLALLALIDDYIGVSNTNMHLRAAVGRRARVLVPNPAEWRWMSAGRGSPWFPGFTLYRQDLHGVWDSALQMLVQDLQNIPR